MIAIPQSAATGSSSFDPFALEIPPASALAAATALSREPLPALPTSRLTGGGQLADNSAAAADEFVGRSRAKKPKPFPCPFTVAIDHRERAAAYPFAGLDAGHNHSYRPLIVEKVLKHLPTGDYSIVGCEGAVVAERKQLSDFLTTLAHRLEQFRNEHERMAEIVAGGGRACVIIESSWHEVYDLRGHFTRMTWQSIRGVYEEWQVKYGVPWRMEGGRRMAERATWEFLWRWWWGREREREVTAEQERAIEDACKGL